MENQELRAAGEELRLLREEVGRLEALTERKKAEPEAAGWLARNVAAKAEAGIDPLADGIEDKPDCGWLNELREDEPDDADDGIRDLFDNLGIDLDEPKTVEVEWKEADPVPPQIAAPKKPFATKDGNLRNVYVFADPDRRPSVLGSGSCYRWKIGAGDAKQRLKNTALARVLKIHTESGGRGRERALHEQFADGQIVPNGERGQEWREVAAGDELWNYVAERSPMGLVRMLLAEIEGLRNGNCNESEEPEARTGRRPDPVEGGHLAIVILELIRNPDAADRRFRDMFNWGAPKAKRYARLARATLAGLE